MFSGFYLRQRWKKKKVHALENKRQLMETMVGKKKLQGPLQRLLILTPTGGSEVFAPSGSPPCTWRFSSRRGLAAPGDAGLASAVPSCPVGRRQPNLGTESDVGVSGRRRVQQNRGGTHRSPLGKQSLPASHAAGPAEKWVREKGFAVSGWFLAGRSCVFTPGGGPVLSS